MGSSCGAGTVATAVGVVGVVVIVGDTKIQ